MPVSTLRQGVCADGGETTNYSRAATVLLTEDEAAMREAVALWLEDDGRWDVREARDGREALEKLDETIDVLVLDRRMPKLSGPEVVDRLDDTDFEGRVVVVSAYKPDDHLEVIDVEAYLTKPITREELIDQLERCVW